MMHGQTNIKHAVQVFHFLAQEIKSDVKSDFIFATCNLAHSVTGMNNE
jgi:hypothetical protein